MDNLQENKHQNFSHNVSFDNRQAGHSTVVTATSAGASEVVYFPF
jgi:hypothetical protein